MTCTMLPVSFLASLGNESGSLRVDKAVIAAGVLGGVLVGVVKLEEDCGVLVPV